MAPMSRDQRFSRRGGVCPVCGGHAELQQGRGVRCYGFVSSDAAWGHCTRSEFAGLLALHVPSGTWSHRLQGPCRCGVQHGADLAPRPLPVAKVAKVANDEQGSEFGLKLWLQTHQAADDSLVGVYLKRRGLSGPFPASLRAHPWLKHGPTGQKLPAMLAAIRRWPRVEVVAIHRTFLARNGQGKADVIPNRMILGPCAGGAVWLGNVGERLALCEGIETSLAFQQSTGIPTWSALSAVNLPAVILPPLPLAREITIGADNDPPGLFYAALAAEKWTAEGRTVRVAVPPVEGWDFLDVLRGAA